MWIFDDIHNKTCKMHNNRGDQRSDMASPTVDLIDESFFEEDDMNDGVPVRESDEGGQDVDRSVLQDDDCSLNLAYKNHLRELIRVIKAEIEQCQEKQKILSRRIQVLGKQPVNPAARKNWYHLFGFPYFKDKSFFPCPMNDDQRLKVYKREIDYHKLEPIRRWDESDCLKLERGVKANAIERKTSGFLVQKGAILEELQNPDLPTKKRAEFRDKLKKIESSINAVKNMNYEALVGDINTKHDWLKIVAVEFGDQRSSEEIEAMWKLCRHPSINRKHWTRSENEALRDIAKKCKERDWAVIALRLNTNRSEFQCMIQYQRKLNTDLLNKRWTEEEDEMLNYLVERSRINDYIPWSTISLCMRNRTRQQIYNRWIFSLNPSLKKGRFTEKEDCLILAGVKHFGQDYCRIAELLPGRNSSQISSRYKNCLSREGPLGRFSVDEDLQLIKLVETHGKNWKFIVGEHLVTRTRSQVRHRYKFLEEWLSKNPDGSVTKAPRRDLGDCKKRNANLWSTIQRALQTSTKKRKDKEINKEDMELLKMTMTNNVEPLKKLSRPCGRKKKVLSKADNLLQTLLKPCYYLPSGRSKAVFTEEEIETRENIIQKLINILQARFAFPFDESIIMDDPVWNEADLKILLALKEKYDRGNFEEEEEGISAQGNAARVTKLEASSSQSLVPFYRLENNIRSPFPEKFPAFMKNAVGLRTVLLSRDNLRVWKTKQKNEKEDISLPAVRPASQALQDQGKKCFSREESAKLFSERMFSLFYWPVQLVRVPPEFDNSELVQPHSETLPDQPPSKKSRRRSLKNTNRNKRLLMKERWKKFREEKANNKSSQAATGHSTVCSAVKSRKRKSELSMD